MPLFRRLPKRGFNPINIKKIAKINLEKIQLMIDKKKLNSSEIININILKKNKIIGNSYELLKILGKGDMKDKINIESNYISDGAKNKLEKIGSTIKIKPIK